MKVKTVDLIGPALDWAVAMCEGFSNYDPPTEKMLPPRKEDGWVELCDYNYSTDWAQGGLIIEREGIDIMKVGVKQWRADCGPATYAPTPLIAAMRCFVASRLGDEIDVPGELMK